MTCHVHGSHRPEVITPHHHHVQPLGMGGPDVASNMVEICPTGHANVHAALAAIIFHPHAIPRVTRKELALAWAGFRAWDAAGRPGNPHAAFGLAHHP